MTDPFLDPASGLMLRDAVAIRQRLEGNYQPGVYSRLVSLYAVAACRQLGKMNDHPEWLNAVLAAEIFADGGSISASELHKLDWLAHRKFVSVTLNDNEVESCYGFVADHGSVSQFYRAFNSLDRTAPDTNRLILRDIFDDSHDPSCAVRTRDIKRLARAAYESRDETGRIDPVRLLILSDALEEAGASGAILTHLRDSGLHVRGCRVLDLILGKR